MTIPHAVGCSAGLTRSGVCSDPRCLCWCHLPTEQRAKVRADRVLEAADAGGKPAGQEALRNEMRDVLKGF